MTEPAQLQAGQVSFSARLARIAGRLRLHADILVWRYGWIWFVVALFFAGSIALWCWVLVPQHKVLLETRQQLSSPLVLAHSSKPVDALVSTPLADAEAEVDRLISTLGPQVRVGQQLHTLYTLAAHQNLKLTQSEYQRIALTAEGIDRLQVNLSFKAGYPQLRRFMESVLLEMPNASIDQLSFKRAHVSLAQVDVKVRLSFWTSAQAPHVPVAAASRPLNGGPP